MHDCRKEKWWIINNVSGAFMCDKNSVLLRPSYKTEFWYLGKNTSRIQRNMRNVYFQISTWTNKCIQFLGFVWNMYAYCVLKVHAVFNFLTKYDPNNDRDINMLIFHTFFLSFLQCYYHLMVSSVLCSCGAWPCCNKELIISYYYIHNLIHILLEEQIQ